MEAGAGPDTRQPALPSATSAESRAYRALLLALYPDDHPYRFPLAGTQASVAALDRSDLARFHARYLVPSAATIIVAGDVDPESWRRAGAAAGSVDGTGYRVA